MPAPELPLGIVIQVALLVADHVQPAVVLTNALLVEPAAIADTVAGDTE
jgi:hypothetical protein